MTAIAELARPLNRPVAPLLRPLVGWPLVGIGFVALQIYIYTAWIVSGDAQRTGTGTSTVSTATKLWALVFQGGSVVMATAVLVWLYRRWRRDRVVSFDMMIVIAWLSTYWQDPIANYLRPVFFYNAQLVNLGSWTEKIPGWISPRGKQFPEPLLWLAGNYTWFVLTGLLVCAVMGLVRNRWPDAGPAPLILAALASMALLDAILELTFVRTEMYAYGGTVHALSVWGGQRYQFPLYEAIGWGAVWATVGILRFYRDDRGHTFLDRQILRKGRPGKEHTVLRILAVIGFVNAIYLGYNVGLQWFALHVDATPAGYPTYIRSGLCGPDTPSKCPGPGVPVEIP